MERMNKLSKTLLSAGLALALGFALAGQAAAQITTSGDANLDPYVGIGGDGPGTLLIENGYILTSIGADIGVGIGGGGLAIVRGAETRWVLSDSLFVGREGVGSLIIEAGAIVGGPAASPVLEELTIAFFPGSSGTVTVKDLGQLNVNGMFGVGAGWVDPEPCTDCGVPGATTIGALNVLSGGAITARGLTLAGDENSIGSVQVIGYPSEISVDETVGGEFGDAMYIGGSGDATLIIKDGGVVNAGVFVGIGRLPGTTSTVTVDGVAQVWEDGAWVEKPSTFTSRGVDESFDDAGAFVVIGRAGTGLFNITNGGQVLIDSETENPGDISGFGLGGSGGSTANLGGERTGILLVSGANSALTVDGGLGFFQIGRDDGALGILNITKGGKVVLVNPDGRSLGLIARKQGSTGIVLVDGVDGVGVPSELDAGRLLGCAKNSDFTTDPLPDENNLFDPGGIGSITVRNFGVVRADIIVIGPDCTVLGDGTLDARVRLVNEGTIVPGSSPGTLTVTGNMTHAGVLNMEVFGTAPGEFDKLVAGGTVTLQEGSLINITTGGATLEPGSVVILEAASIEGTTTIILDGSNLGSLRASGGTELRVKIERSGDISVVERGKTKRKRKTKGGD